MPSPGIRGTGMPCPRLLLGHPLPLLSPWGEPFQAHQASLGCRSQEPSPALRANGRPRRSRWDSRIPPYSRPCTDRTRRGSGGLRSSTDMSESMPRSKKPTVGAGGVGMRSTACTSFCKKETRASRVVGAGAPRSWASTSPEEAEASFLSELSEESICSSKGGRSLTASSNTDQSTDITTDVVESWRTSLSRALMPCSGVNHRPPRAARLRSILSPLLRRLSDLRPCSPGDGLSRQAQCPPVPC